MAVIGNSCYLGGQVVGLGKIHKDGSEDFRWLDKPIHNRIVSTGLDHLLCFDGNVSGGLSGNYSDNFANVNPLLGRARDNTNHYGALQYCAIGTDGSATSFSDTELKSMAGTYFSNFKMVNGIWYKGTRTPHYGKLQHRVTYVSPAVSSATTVREIGIFGRYGATPSYPMFARVVLDVPVELNSGESIIITYQLEQTAGSATVEYHDSFFGLLDNDGNPLQYAQKLYISRQNSSSASTYHGCPLGSTGGNNSTSGDQYLIISYLFTAPLWYYDTSLNNYNYYYFPISYSTSSSKNFPADWSSEYSSMEFYRSKLGSSWSFVDYTGVGNNDKHRDMKYVWGPMVPSEAEYIDIYYLRANNMDYRFGHFDTDGTTWIPQAWRKYNTQTVTFTLRTRYVTEDTVQG